MKTQFGILKRYLRNLEKVTSTSNIIRGLQQNQTLDFQEQVRKAVVAAEDSGKADEFKIAFNDIEFLPPVTPPNNVIAFGRNYQDHASELNHGTTIIRIH